MTRRSASWKHSKNGRRNENESPITTVTKSIEILKRPSCAGLMDTSGRMSSRRCSLYLKIHSLSMERGIITRTYAKERNGMILSQELVTTSSQF